MGEVECRLVEREAAHSIRLRKEQATSPLSLYAHLQPSYDRLLDKQN